MNEDGIAAHAGFPNAAHDPMIQGLQLQQLLVPQPHSTYFFRVAGNQWQADGIFDGDIAIIDRSLQPLRDIVAWIHEDTFALSRFTQKQRSQILVWGVVTAIIHQTRTQGKRP